MAAAVGRCCCCLLRPADKYVTTPYTHLGATEIFSDMLEECFQIRLTLSNAECKICEHCVGRLRDASDFKRLVQRNQAELKKQLDTVLYGKVEEVPATAEESGTYLELMLHEELVIKTEGPAEEAASTEDIIPHGDKAVKSEGPDDDASNDEERVTLPSHAGTVAAWPMSVLAREQLARTCPVSLENLHADPAPHQCRLCRETFHNEYSFAAHMKEIHSEGFGAHSEEVYICDSCGMRFRRRLILIRHLQQHEGTPYSSNTHAKEIHNTNSITDVHNKQKSLSCDICSKQFSHRGHLKRHLRIHTGEKPFICDVCNKPFRHRHNLNTHMRIHTGHKPHSCDVCHKRFSQSNNLNTHMRTHTGQRPHSCSVCNKRFNQTSSLNVHMRTHTGEKPHCCNICNKRFNQTSSLNVHMRTHTGQKPHSCSICNKGFSQTSNLKIHMRIHTGEKPHSCSVCNKQLRTPSSLNKHMKIHTGQKPGL